MLYYVWTRAGKGSAIEWQRITVWAKTDDSLQNKLINNEVAQVSPSNTKRHSYLKEQ